MPIGGWFKKSQKQEKDKKEKKEEKNQLEERKQENLPSSAFKANIILDKNFEILPIISEKTKLLIEKNNTYVFKVRPISLNKTEIKKAIEDIFKVKVENINTANYKKRLRGRTKIPSSRPRFKKVFVKINKDQKINIFD